MIEFPTISQARGSLTVAEVAKTVPFDVQRTFFVYNVPTAELRGAHAHRTCHQLLICVHGSVSADVRSQGERATFHLTTPSEGLLIRAGTWGGQHSYSADAVLCVLASQPYDASDYIHDLADFEGYERRLRRTTEAGTQHAYGQES